MNPLLRVAFPSSSLVTMAAPIPHWDVTSDYLSEVRDSPVRISIRDFFCLTFCLCARLDRNGTMRSCVCPLQLCGSSSWRKMKVKKENLSLFPNGPVYAVIFVNEFGYHESDRWPLDDDRLREDFFYEAAAFP